MYYIVSWDHGDIIDKTSKLSVGKRLTRKLGHTGQHNGKYYAPVARLQDENGNCVYNPIFRVENE